MANEGTQVYMLAMAGYFVAYLLYVGLIVLRNKVLGRIGTGVLMLSWVTHTVFLVERGLYYYRQYQGFVLPSTNMFEAISYLCWLLVLVYLIVESRVVKTRAFGAVALLLPVAGMIYIAKGMNPDPREFMPSLKSYWLVFHVSCMMISYSIFAMAAVFAWLYILRSRGLARMERIDPRFNLKFYDETSAKLVFAGFPVLTLGVFLGAVWADQAWGRYWGWDPKEVWALITWLVYLAYIHLRTGWNWVGYKAALFNVAGFGAVLITFQGVNMLDNVFALNSIHAYTSGEGGGYWQTFMLALLLLALLLPLFMVCFPVPRNVALLEKRGYEGTLPEDPPPPPLPPAPPPSVDEEVRD